MDRKESFAMVRALDAAMAELQARRVKALQEYAEGVIEFRPLDLIAVGLVLFRVMRLSAYVDLEHGRLMAYASCDRCDARGRQLSSLWEPLFEADLAGAVKRGRVEVGESPWEAADRRNGNQEKRWRG